MKILFIVLGFLASAIAGKEQMIDQLKKYGITDKTVLEVLEKVPRHEFVPPARQKSAYGDHAMPIGSGQTISQPFIVAYMTSKLELKKSDKVLEVGTGSGYQAAVLAELAGEVYSIEIIPELSKRADETLKKLNYKNIKLKVGDGYEGWTEHAPFDKIIVTAAPEKIPEPLIQQLKNGGRMIVPVGNEDQRMTILMKNEKGLSRQQTIDVRFVPMTGKAQD